jgi:Flp pilus assembly protein TadD
MRLPSVLLLSLSFGLVCGAADAAEWTRLKATNFTFVGDASERQIRRVAQQLEQFREVMLRALPPSAAPSPVPIVVLVFANDRSFEPFKPRFQGRTVAVAGFFRSGQDVGYIAINGDFGEAAVRTVFHEYSHFLVSNTLGFAPAWVNEGLAEVYETFEERDGGKSAILGIAPREHVEELRSRTLIPLSELVAVDHSSPMYNEGSRRGLFYAQSWAFMHYLTFGSETRRAQLLRYLTSVRGGASSDEALKKEFGTDLSAIEKELRQYVANYTFPARMGTFETTARAVVGARAEMLSEGEAQGYLGDLLARSERTDDARAYLKKVITASPDAARALFALGFLELRASNLDEALPLLERAATLKPDEPAFLMAYGHGLVERLRGAASDDPQRESTSERARSVLSKAVELDSTVAHTLATLGYLELANGESQRAVDLFKRAVASAPSQESYRMALAEALARQGDYEEATNYFGVLLAQGSEPEIRNRAREGLARVAQLRRLAVARTAAARTAESGPDAQPPVPAAAPSAPTATPSASTAAAPSDSAVGQGGRFIPVLRELGAGEQRVLGVFRSIQCRQGSIVLQVQTATELMNFAAGQLGEVDFISYRTDTPGGVNCGAVPGTPPVLATYRPSPGGASADAIHGQAVAIELIPDGYVPR